jgi:hypothetical protein
LPVRPRLEFRDQSLQLRSRSRATVRSRGGADPIPLSTAEKRVFVLENRRLGVGNLIAISILDPFRRYRPTAEIDGLLRGLAADRQRNSTPYAGLAKFGTTCSVLN